MIGSIQTKEVEHKARYVTAGVIGQVALGEGYYLVTIEAPEVVTCALPGEFVMIRTCGEEEPLLPRPFSFGELFPEKGTFTLLYKVVGRGTARMADWKPGEQVSVLGPLGRAWPLPAPGQPAALVGRGLGIAPLLCLARRLAEQGSPVYGFLSSRWRRLVPGYQQMLPYARRIWCSTDDDPTTPPLVTEFLARLLERERVAAAYVCGARRLIRAVGWLAARHSFPAWASVEQHMACGFGACKGCVIPVRAASEGASEDWEYERVCVEGPVFPVDRLIVEELGE